MIALVTDEDFNARIIRGLLRKAPHIDLITADRAGMLGRPDAEVAARAAEHGRVLITHDVNTMIHAALDRLRLGLPMTGIIAVPQGLSIGAAIADLELLAVCADPADMNHQIVYLPI